MVGFPRFSNYGQYSSDNYGAHCLRLDWGSVTVWYSYNTPVAFRADGHNRVVRENDWGPTTGKHLNWIDGGDKRRRVSSEEFEQRWKEQVEPLFAERREVEDEVKADEFYRIPVNV